MKKKLHSAAALLAPYSVLTAVIKALYQAVPAAILSDSIGF
jgi:hypothetical protein